MRKNSRASALGLANEGEAAGSNSTLGPQPRTVVEVSVWPGPASLSQARSSKPRSSSRSSGSAGGPIDQADRRAAQARLRIAQVEGVVEAGHEQVAKLRVGGVADQNGEAR